MSELVEMVAVMILRLRIDNCNGRRDLETGGVRLQRLPFDRKVEALRYLSKRVLQCPEFNLLAETLINA